MKIDKNELIILVGKLIESNGTEEELDKILDIVEFNVPDPV